MAAGYRTYIRTMQTALHIAALAAQLKKELVGGQIEATEFYKKLRTALFLVRNDRERVGLVFVFHPAGSGACCVPVSKIKLETTEKPWPIFGLDGAKVVDVIQPSLDRIFELVVMQGGENRRVVFEVLGPNGNLWLLDRSGGKLATLRNRKFVQGGDYKPPETSDRMKPFDVSGAQLRDRLGELTGRSPLATLKNILLGFNDTMIKETLSRANPSGATFDPTDPNHAEALANAVRQMAERFRQPESAYLYERRGSFEVYPFKLTFTELQPEKFKSLSAATLEMITRQKTTVNEAGEEQRVIKAVAAAIKRHERLIRNVEADIKKAADYEWYKRLGELLQMNRDQLRKGMASIEVDDILSETSEKVVIELDPAISPNANIEEYFRRHRKGREGLELLQRRCEIVTEELKSLRAMNEELEADLDSAREKYAAELFSLLPRETDKRDALPRLPYREARLSTGLTIFVGRDGADNDRTTFEFAKPYELWFHTQQCAGSHVVMKFPNKSFVPSKREIEETAAIAAFHSKARHDSLVPVAYTERRHVRKPRKAKPGLVMVELEKSVMVVPQKERAEQGHKS
jgi:predicted ribosome quality control (RQC) complex YloA/Tae2 family protein